MRFGNILDVSRRFDRRFIGLNRRRGLCRLWRMGLLLLVSVFFFFLLLFFFVLFFSFFPGGRVSSFETVMMNKLLNIIQSIPFQSNSIPQHSPQSTNHYTSHIQHNIHILTPPPFSQTASNSPPTTNTFTSPTRACTPSQAKTTPPTRPTFTNSTSLPTANA